MSRAGWVVGWLAAVGCSSYNVVGDAARAPSSGGDMTAAASATADAASTAAPPPEQQGAPDQGLTAGAWDDNHNYDYFLKYLDHTAEINDQPPLTMNEREEAYQLFSGDRDDRVDLDIAVLFDTTGSMGDELRYLTVEVENIAADIADIAPDAHVRWALVTYRDHGDLYVTRRFDFTSDLEQFHADLSRQTAEGGGDYPEASAEGLMQAVTLSWRDDPDVARMAFWIADAPHHGNATELMTQSIRIAAMDDIHVYPVAASGVDELTELTMRSAAQVTGGRYLFLTDDSGVGDSHKEPSVPCYFVTSLNDAMVRMVEIERSGVYVEPHPDQIIRTGGNPENGACVLEDGTEVTAF